MVMMGSQTFFLYFQKKLVKYLLVSEKLYIFAARRFFNAIATKRHIKKHPPFCFLKPDGGFAYFSFKWRTTLDFRP